MLPAGRGDCLWIEYGSSASPHRVLIDGGVKSTYQHIHARLEGLPRAERKLDLLIVSHIDLDHIAGALELLRNPPECLVIQDVWFNDFDHLPVDEGILGPKQGESLAARIEGGNYPWNVAFGGNAVMIDGKSLPVHTLIGGMKLTLLSPTKKRLRRLRSTWQRKIEEAGLEAGSAGWTLEGLGHPDEEVDVGILGDERIDIDELVAQPFRKDSSRANGSSIAVLAEYEGKRCLFAADAFSEDILAATKQLAKAERSECLPVDAFKLAHHGGSKNTSAELVDSLACDRFLFSTDGSYYNHPDRQSIARVVMHGRVAGNPTLMFNYRSEETRVWDGRRLKRRYDYEAVYPPQGAGLLVEL